MALSDSMFLFEIVVEEVENYLCTEEFSIKSQFLDVFTLYLQPEEYDGQRRKKLIRRKSKVRNKTSIQNINLTDQSALLTNSIEWLSAHMKNHPLELSLWSKKYPKKRLGGTSIHWSKLYIVYLNKLKKNPVLKPVVVNGMYHINDISETKCIASITLSIKLTHIKYMNTLIDSSLSYSLNDSDKLNAIDLKKFNRDNIKNKIPIKAHESGRKLAPNFFKENNEIQHYLDRTVKSDTKIDNVDPITILRRKSLSTLYGNKKDNPLTYIFGCPNGQFGNRVYCVSYFTVENEVSGIASPKQTKNPNKDDQPKGELNLKPCDCKCQNQCSIDLPQETELFKIVKCNEKKCDKKKATELPLPPDDGILLDFTNMQSDCCQFTEKIEEVVGGVAGKIKVGDEPCFCTCECTFGFTKKTTYCGVCGGYENIGDKVTDSVNRKPPFPCPVYHKLIDKSKLRNWSTSGSDSKRRGDDQSIRSMKMGSGLKAAATGKRQTARKSLESEKDINKGVKKKDDRFKFNYGYKGIPPQIGHSDCGTDCTGNIASSVPKSMGWLWTSDCIPGMKFRPMWKPGAINKYVLRLLKMAKNPGEVIGKKRRKDAGRYKRPLKRPLLVVHKKDGEYTVTMETMKTFAKPRAPCQHPYEDKPVLTYTIGRTEEENRDRRKRRERAQRRLERQQRQFIQSTFRNVCQDICLRTYQQALGILPGTEDPFCTCFAGQPDRVNVGVSCSCSEVSSSNGSDTDLDEWIVEFTPPTAIFDPTYKIKKVFKSDTGTQYTYLDYRVKLLDRFGNPVPRFFRGPDGKQQCSDLGGFWSPEHKWLEINVDGYVAPDERWAPNTFIGPSGEIVDAESGKFQGVNNDWYVVGVDGYVDNTGKWRPYPKGRGIHVQKSNVRKFKGGAGDKRKQGRKDTYKESEVSWSCFGDVSPKHLSRMGIVGHGQDKKVLLSSLRDMIARGEDIRIPVPSTVYRLPESKKSKRVRIAAQRGRRHLEDIYKCHHPVPSEKGILATDAHGHKTYFRLKGYKHKTPKERLANLTHQGISLSSFHVPCFNSFINSEILKMEQRKKLMALAGQPVGTQT